MRKCFFIGFLFLAGCATAQLNQGLKGFVGHNIMEVVARLGYPDAQREMMGDTLYIWSTSQDSAFPLMTSTSTAGMVGSTPVYGTTTGMSFIPVNYNCTVQVATDANGTIKNYQWSGNEGGCSRYAESISRK